MPRERSWSAFITSYAVFCLKKKKKSRGLRAAALLFPTSTAFKPGLAARRIFHRTDHTFTHSRRAHLPFICSGNTNRAAPLNPVNNDVFFRSIARPFDHFRGAHAAHLRLRIALAMILL